MRFLLGGNVLYRVAGHLWAAWHEALRPGPVAWRVKCRSSAGSPTGSQRPQDSGNIQHVRPLKTQVTAMSGWTWLGFTVATASKACLAAASPELLHSGYCFILTHSRHFGLAQMHTG